MKTIRLTQGYTACIDDADFAAVTAVGRWCYEAGYAVHYFADKEGRRKRLWMHRLLMQPIPAGMQVHHINANRLDNQRANLRLATKSQNQAAKGIQKNSTSGHKGVTLRHGKYDVRLRHYGKRLYLGRYESLQVAHAAYAFAHITLWGEFTSEYDPTQLSSDVKVELATRISQWQKPVCAPS